MKNYAERARAVSYINFGVLHSHWATACMHLRDAVALPLPSMGAQGQGGKRTNGRSVRKRTGARAARACFWGGAEDWRHMRVVGCAGPGGADP